MTGNDGSRTNRGWFKKGQSGNPGGRPKGTGAPAKSAFDVMIERTVTITHDGIGRELTVDEALQQRTYRDALAGKRLAIREVLRWIGKREQWLAKKRPRALVKVSSKTRQDPDNADEALLLLDIARIDPVRDEHRREGERRRLLLEPWAVSAASRRRRGARKLTRRDYEEIRRSTRMDSTVKLPEQFDE